MFEGGSLRIKFSIAISCLTLSCMLFVSCSTSNLQETNDNVSFCTTLSSISKTFYDMSDRIIDFAHCEKMSIVIEDSSLGAGEYILSNELFKEFFLLVEKSGEPCDDIENQFKEKYPIYCYEKETESIIKFGFLAINQDGQIGLLTKNMFKALPKEWQSIEKFFYNITFYAS